MTTATLSAPPAAASVWLSGYQAGRTRFPPRPALTGWPATRLPRGQVLGQLANGVSGPGSGEPGRHAAGLALLLDWLAGQDGGSWQERWLASGAEAAGAAWAQLAGGWLTRPRGPAARGLALLAPALVSAVCADVLRPSLGWLAAGGCDHGGLARAMAASRDPGGFAQLRALGEADQGATAAKMARTLRRAAVILAAKGGVLTSITIGDLLELLDIEASVHGAARSDAAACYRLFREMGIFGPAAPARLRELRTAGQRTPAEMIDRHHLTCQPIRDLLVDYLKEPSQQVLVKLISDGMGAWA